MNKLKKGNNQLISEIEVDAKLNILVKGQINNSQELEGIRNDLQRGFIGLALRNEELLKSNQKLQKQLDNVCKELNLIKQKREEKAARKEKWDKRKRLAKRDPMTREIYLELIKATEGPTECLQVKQMESGLKPRHILSK